jgi:hypothetical protein
VQRRAAAAAAGGDDAAANGSTPYVWEQSKRLPTDHLTATVVRNADKTNFASVTRRKQTTNGRRHVRPTRRVPTDGNVMSLTRDDAICV